MAFHIDFDKYSFFTDRVSEKNRVRIIVLSVIVYVLSKIFLYPFIGDSIFMFMMIPVIVASALVGLKAGLITQIICFFLSMIIRMAYHQESVYFQKFIIGFIMLLIVNFIVGFLREIHKKIKLELSQRKIAESKLEITLSELRKSLDELESARSEIKTLSGLLPICSSCHRIRDDENNWLNLENFIADRSEAEFSHGICPDCAQKLYPGYVR